MKKYFSLLIAFVAFLSSCTNDDIGSSYTKDEHYYETFTYNVNTQPVFDEFNATSSIKEQILGSSDGDLYIGVYTYIYDKNGDLKDKNISYSKTFGSETCEFTLEDGNYTAVSVEMVVDKDDKYQSPRFEIKGEEKLSTLEVAYRTYIGPDGNTHYESTSVWYQCVGVSTQTINVERTMQAVTVSPNAIGVVVNCAFYNFNKSSYERLSLFTKNAPIGRFLDPAKTGDERFRYEKYNEKNKVTGRSTVRSPFAELVRIDVYLLEEGNDVDCELGAGNINTEGGISYPWYTSGWNKFEDGKTYYAGAYYIGGERGSDGDGGIFDNINDFNSWYNTAKTMYQPANSSALTEPFTVWGSSVSTVQSNMSDYKMYNGEAGKAIYSSENSYYITYEGKGLELMYMYYFTSETTGLYQSVAAYSKTDLPEEQLVAELNEKYTYLSTSGNYSLYMTKDQKSGIILMAADDYWFVQFVDPSSLNQSSAPAAKLPNSNIEKVLKERANVRNFITKEETMIPLDITRDNREMRLCKNSK